MDYMKICYVKWLIQGRTKYKTKQKKPPKNKCMASTMCTGSMLNNNKQKCLYTYFPKLYAKPVIVKSLDENSLLAAMLTLQKR